ncbi:MAG: glycosyltransferase family 4 protein [Verrucomicrobiota bacterium]
MTVALLHYAYPPVVGGVEFVMEQHTDLFARNGYAVRIITGHGESALENVTIREIPELLPSHPLVVEAQEEIRKDPGHAPKFEALTDYFTKAFREAIEGCDAVIVHNVMMMHFNLAATTAIARLAEENTGEVRFINWIHDLAAINPDYDFGPHLKSPPFRQITLLPKGMQSVIISKNRQRELVKLTGASSRDCPVVPNGVESIRLLRLTRDVRRFNRRFGIIYNEFVLIQPARILRRKNVEYGIRVLAELRKLGHSAFYMVTGAPDPHHEASREYGTELKKIVVEEGLERDFAFVSEYFPVSDTDLIGLYSISDALFLPSKQEGFGLPLLEAGVFRLPTFCPRIEPMQSILDHNVSLFDLDEPPAAVAKRLIRFLQADPGHLARKQVLQRYSWDLLFEKKIQPLLKKERKP